LLFIIGWPILFCTENPKPMSRKQLIFRNLIYYWRTNLPIIAGIAVSVAVLSGALLVGQSMRDSLRVLFYERIGLTESVVAADHFFQERLNDAFQSKGSSCPIIYLKGIVTQEQTGLRAYSVNIYGIDDRFWKFHGVSHSPFPNDRAAFVGAPLAERLNLKPGDGLLLRVEAPQAIPREWLYGRRDTVGRTIRLNCSTILPSSKMGDFSLRPNQGTVYSLFVPLSRLQKDLKQSSRINMILLGRQSQGSSLESLQSTLQNHCSIEDYGLTLHPLRSGDHGFSLESSRILLDDSSAGAALRTAAELKLEASGIYTYLANSIRANHKEIPYSAIAAADLGKGSLASIQVSGIEPEPNRTDSIWLTDWAARDLGVSPGNPVDVDYYIWQENGTLITRTASFHMAGIVPIPGNVDASFSPEIPGISEARSLSDWDPPFPLDLNRIRPKDEQFWDQYKATPKAFIPLARGQELWKNRFGQLTAVRMIPREKSGSAQALFVRELKKNLDPIRTGFSIQDVKVQGLASSKGSTDFGTYFVYFSFFLIVAAILLSALFFKLMIEQRAREIGLLRAAGWPPGMLRNNFLIESTILSLAGSLLGLLGSILYGSFMMYGLRHWWNAAVGTQRLTLHYSWIQLVIGAAAGIGVSLLLIIWTLRKLRQNSPRLLLAGALESRVRRVRRSRIFQILSIVSLMASLLLILGSFFDAISQLAGFFSSGFLLLISFLSFTIFYLNRPNPRPIQGCGWPALLHLAVRNAAHRPARSLLCVGLIASATFIIVSTETFRMDTRSISLEPAGGTGGFPFIGESDLPLVYDLNTAEGREAAGIPETVFPAQQKNAVLSFRERPGDEASCLNLYAPREPRILGAPVDFLAGRFSFQGSLASNREQEQNPWLLLETADSDSVIPAIADANTIQYILHLKLGSEITVGGSNGDPVRLRLVGALKDSIFQGVLLISQSNFLRVFPDREGYRFFLIDIPKTNTAARIQKLEEGLSGWGFRAESSQAQLSAFHEVENTYLSTFQSLGALGLILGSIGLAAVLLRNILERRGELALLRAVGYRSGTLSKLVLAENMLLVSWGLACGAISALVSILPALFSRGTGFPIIATVMVLAAVWLAGMLSSIFASLAAFRSPLLASLRSE
jgi:putative ABC transport system permease protein